MLRPQEIVGVFQFSGVIPMYSQQLLKNMCFLVDKPSWVLLSLVQCFLVATFLVTMLFDCYLFWTTVLLINVVSVWHCLCVFNIIICCLY